ncbi:MAG: aldo/keto reductase [Bacteroidales bacterium]
MEEIALGNTSATISCLGLGTMYIGSKTDENTSFSLLDSYFEHGGTFLDTANKYASWVPGFQGGESEQNIGKWLATKKNRHNLFIASKEGFPYGTIPRSLKKEVIISEYKTER